jgi:hypothetical protein
MFETGKKSPWQGGDGTIPQRTIDSHIRMVSEIFVRGPRGRSFANCSKDHLLRRMDNGIWTNDKIFHLQILRSELEPAESTVSIFSISVIYNL